MDLLDLNEDASRPVGLCSICKKPFSSPLSLRRHVTYCRRSQSRLRKRIKPCGQCAEAKAKCTSEIPCARCKQRDINCDKLEMPLMHDRSMEEKRTDIRVSSNCRVTPHQLSNQSIGYDNSEWTIAQIPNHSVARHRSFEATRNEYPVDPQPLDWFNAFLKMPESTRVTPFVNKVVRYIGTSSGYRGAEILASLPQTSTAAQRTAILLMQTFRTVPGKMLQRENFPSFIHPQLHRYALPEPLAVCERIACIFASRAPDINNFIWRTIMNEQMRYLKQEVISREDLLAAVQAHLVYIIMRIEASVTDGLEWNREMVILGDCLCLRLKSACDEYFCPDEVSNPSTTWEEWVFAESRRRTNCMWYIMARIVNCTSKSKESVVDEQAHHFLPLPSSKSEWEATNQTSWLEALAPDLGCLRTIGDLREAIEQHNNPHYALKLDSWRARKDQLGTLVTFAATL